MRTDLNLDLWSISSECSHWSEDFYESIYFLGNGRMGSRGYVSSEPNNRPIQKGIYLAGIFGEIKPGITDFVNLPTPICERILIDGKESQLASNIKSHLNMKEATLTMQYTLQGNNKCVEVEHQRFLPHDYPALIMQRLKITPLSDMELTIFSGINIESCNSPIPDDQTKENTETIQLSVLTNCNITSNDIECLFEIQGTDLTVSQKVNFKCPEFSYVDGDKSIAKFIANTNANQELLFDKAAHILTSRDVDPRILPIPDSWDYDILLGEHKNAWNKIWGKCDFELFNKDAELQTGLRYSMFHLLGSCNSKDPTVSIGARGLSHGRYKGCYFWDTDLFMLPFFLENNKEAAKNLCEYRVLTLDSAKKHSKSMNTLGARYPWMAALDGSEQCETWDIGCSELHITADVAYALEAYCKIANDENFYLDKAAEVFIETARFWVSRYTYRPETNDVDLLFCKGPDEYCGITNNNLFTNVMVQNNLELAIKAANDLSEKRPEIYAKLQLSSDEIEHMRKIKSLIKWPRNPINGHLAQDETLHHLEPVDISKVKLDEGASYHHVCFDRLQRYQVIKQADVLLLMTRLPHLFTKEEKLLAWKDFEPICLHDSTLSFASHALFALQNDIHNEGYEYLRKALLLDLRDVMGNTGHEGLHLACMGEAWQAAYYVFKNA